MQPSVPQRLPINTPDGMVGKTLVGRQEA